ncbi:hypothetical protein H5410_002154 [Solanum commersonii]|uniref:Uncharacterized protein n=1 Tax=Solanum commersonii TaxID=4109 RepID=A0A9J6B0W4_SOLCO|nr:hypothetical protein H5410_002154 [Solanum commersonii]
MARRNSVVPIGIILRSPIYAFETFLQEKLKSAQHARNPPSTQLWSHNTRGHKEMMYYLDGKFVISSTCGPTMCKFTKCYPTFFNICIWNILSRKFVTISTCGLSSCEFAKCDPMFSYICIKLFFLENLSSSQPSTQQHVSS